MIKAITENTRISIGVLIGLIALTSFVSGVYFLSENTAKAVEKVVIKQDRYSEDITNIRIHMERQTAQIESINKILKEGN